MAPTYPFNEPGDDVRLYEGSLFGPAERAARGRVLLRCGSRLEVVWRLDEPPPQELVAQVLLEGEIRLRIHQASAVHEVAGLRRNSTEGLVHGQSMGDESAPLRRVLLHWMNLPAFHSPTRICLDDGSWWNGRWRFPIGPWQLTLDTRQDHARVWEVLGSEHNFAMTHVMEVTRSDDGEFTAADFELLRQTLHFGVSFALGRWVGPAAPVGISAAGSIAWQQWAAVFCVPGRNGGLAWLHHTRSHDLQEFLSCAYRAFIDPDRTHTTRLLLSMAIEANHSGRVEQRTMTAFSALELLSWVVLKLTSGFSRTKYDALRADGRIRMLLERARVDTSVDATRQPTLMQFAIAESSSDVPLDGPDAVKEIRNRLVHPNIPQDEVYHLDGLVTDAWLLSRHYLNLLILHWLDYRGSYQTVLGPGGWAGDSDPVPWASDVNQNR
ncbi:hypothetical protein YIM_32395 [Amycolatopsis sp. YIM 10]|nr:hypothetical protein YIM_32395 [Amycolatopsis sp. YIM 10]